MKPQWLIASIMTMMFIAKANAEQALPVTMDGLKDGSRISANHAFCIPDVKTRSADGANVNPAVRWESGPEGTRSYAIIMYDKDVPVSFANANQEGKTIAVDAARKDFYHWIRINMPADTRAVSEGEVSRKVDKNGKQQHNDVSGREGANDFGTFMKGTFYGYDGPCPPWNDEKTHHYYFTVYALDVPNLNLEGDFSGQKALQAMEGHVLAKGSVMGTYSLNPKVMN